MEQDDEDTPFEEFEAAQAGAVAHLETMSAIARDVAQDAMGSGSPTDDARNHAARLSQVAERCDALAVLLSLLELPPDADWPG